MSSKSISSLIIDKFGLNLYQNSLKFLSNKINIIQIREEPIKIRSIILDNEREFHLIIDERKKEIFHDCPLFLIYSERNKKICVHLIKLLLIIRNKIALRILNDFKNYNLTSEDFGSKKKSKNFLLLANQCIENNNCVEALSYLNKGIINQYDSEAIIKDYLRIAIENNLFIEFFEFLRKGYENELGDYFNKFNDYIEEGFKKFLNIIPEYSFFDLLKIIESVDKIFEFKDISFIASLLVKLKKMANSTNFNNNYISIYLIKKHIEKLIRVNPAFKEIISQEQLDSLKKKLLNYFYSEIDNFCVIEKLKLLKRQFQIINIPKEKFSNEYRKYKEEIKELEKKVYLKKFAFLKLLMEKYNIKKTKGEFRKKRNTYNVKHNEENLKNPVYNYIISRIGFYGINDQVIKSSEIGINYFLIKELFLDDLSDFPDIYYYRKQFWGDKEDYEVNSIDGFSLLSDSIGYNYEIDQKQSKDVIIIEWDLANRPIQGSIVNAYGSQIIIPDQNNPLFHDLKPFDLCYCQKTPVKIESSIIKTVNVITKCSFKDAIRSVSKGMSFIEGYYPLSLVRAVLDKEIDPFYANYVIVNNPNKLFIPNYLPFINAFKDFLFDFIFKEKKYVFEMLKLNFKEKSDQILTLLNLNNELAGLDLPYSEIFKEVIYPEIDIKDFKTRFLNEIHSSIKEILIKREIGSTIIFDLKKLGNTPFSKYSNEILNIRKNEFKSSKVNRVFDKGGIKYNITEISNTYYGKKFSKILHIEGNSLIKPDKFKKFLDFSSKLKLRINVIDSPS